MQVGDLVISKATGELSVVTGVGNSILNVWITLYESGDTVYHAEYFEVISSAKD
jgi:hypothetical protein